MVRVFAISGLMMAASFAVASFDLMFIPDPNGRVHRYDPITNVQLGSFQAQTGTRHVAGNTLADPLFTGKGGSSGTYRINGSTGEIVSLFDSSRTYVQLLEDSSNSTVFMLRATQLSRVNIATGSVTSVNLPSGFTASTIVQTGSGNYCIIGETTARDIVAYSYTSANALVSATPVTLVAGASVAANSRIGSAALVPSGLSSQAIAFTYRRSDDAVIVAKHFIVSGVINSASSTLAFAPNFVHATSTANTVAGHAGFFVVGANELATATSVLQFSSATSVELWASNTISGFTPIMNTQWSMTNIVAPEPGTLAALGLGLVAVVRKRRSR